MQRCISLAENGLGNVAPNPMVGAILVMDDKIVSEGFTSPFGGPHAEVNAISKVSDQSILEQCTLYVSLEPCAHFGKTPPCADLIVESKIPRVVIGARDSFSEVNGKGIDHLRKNGVDVIEGVLDKECRELNKRFFTFHEKQRPYIILKWAQSIDGFMDINRNNSVKQINWITTPETKSLIHLWRSQEMGILVGRKTIENDNPKLDVRLIDGKNPTRIILDPELNIDESEWSHAQLTKTIILNRKISKVDGNIEFIQLDNFILESILKTLFERNIQSIIVEGGPHTLQSFINSNNWDEARVLTGSTTFSKGLSAPNFDFKAQEKLDFGTDHLEIYRNK